MRGSLTASAAWCGASSSSPLSSTHGLQKPADLRGGQRKARRGAVSPDPGEPTASERGPRGCGGERAEGRSWGGAGGRDGAGEAQGGTETLYPGSAPPRRVWRSVGAGSWRRQRARWPPGISVVSAISMGRLAPGTHPARARSLI